MYSASHDERVTVGCPGYWRVPQHEDPAGGRPAVIETAASVTGRRCHAYNQTAIE